MRLRSLVFVSLVVGGSAGCDDGTVGAAGGTGGAGTGGESSTGGAVSSGGSASGGPASTADGGSSTGGSSVGTGGDASSGGASSTGGTGGATGGTGGGNSSDLPAGTFLMDGDGYVIFEAEDITDTPPGDWVIQTDSGPCDDNDCEPSGGSYLQYESDGLGDCANHGSPPSEKMTLDFEVKESGYHRMVWRNLRDHRAGNCEHDKNNDSFVTFPGAKNDDSHFTEPFKVFGGGSGTFNWSGKYDIHDIGKDDVCVELDAGVETMELSGRSNHHAIDRIAIIHTGSDEQSCRDQGTGGLDERANTGQAQ